MVRSIISIKSEFQKKSHNLYQNKEVKKMPHKKVSFFISTCIVCIIMSNTGNDNEF